MSFNDSRVDIPLVGSVAQAYLATVQANINRSVKSGYPIGEHDISPAEVNLAALFMDAGVTGWEQQHSLGPYWPDFYFLAEALVVEVDGTAWYQDTQLEAERDEVLRRCGAVEVLHLRAIEVFTDGAGCVERVKARLVEHRNSKEAA